MEEPYSEANRDVVARVADADDVAPGRVHVVVGVAPGTSHDGKGMLFIYARNRERSAYNFHARETYYAHHGGAAGAAHLARSCS